MDGYASDSGKTTAAEDLRLRLEHAGPGRLAEAVRRIVEHAYALLEDLNPTEAELDALVQFLTDVGYATDARRQEWVLLADVFGVSARVGEACADAAPGTTPATLPGPFYRADAPRVENGGTLCRDGVGTPISVRGTVCDLSGQPVAGASVEVWHANGNGRYENQDPDNQPEHNLRGCLMTGADGGFAFRSIRPGGYALPTDGPVGQLALRLGLSLDRPAHIHFAVTASGFRRLVTAIFDGSDPAIGRDALFAVRPPLIGHFRPEGEGLTLDVALILAADAAFPAHRQG